MIFVSFPKYTNYYFFFKGSASFLICNNNNNNNINLSLSTGNLNSFNDSNFISTDPSNNMSNKRSNSSLGKT